MRRVRSQFLQSVLRPGFAVRGSGSGGATGTRSLQGTGAPTGAAIWAAGFAICLLVIAAMTPAMASADPKALIGTIGAGAPGQGGALNTPRGVATNLATGDVYVVDGANFRIQQFSASGGFIRAWGWDVVDGVNNPGAANDNGTGFERCDVTAGNSAGQCKVGVSGAGAGQLANPQGIAVDQSNGYLYVTSQGNRRVDVFSGTGAFAGAFGWGVATGAAAFQVCTTTCQIASAAGADAGRFANLTASGPSIDPTAAPGTVYVPEQINSRVSKFETTISGGILTSASFVKAFGWDVAPSAVSEEQEIRVRATAGQFTLTFGGDTTPNLAFNDSAANVEAALNALPSISTGGGSVTVTGGPGDASGSRLYVVRFGGTLAATDVAGITAASGTTALTGGTSSSGVAVATRAPGGAAGVGFESCTTASGCKAGVAGGAAPGQFGSANGGPTSSAVDSTGAVYVAGGPLNGGGVCAPTNVCRIQKFNPSTTTATDFGPLTGAGRLVFSSGTPNQVAAFAVAVDPATDHVFVLRKGDGETASAAAYRVLEYDSSGAFVEAHPTAVLNGVPGVFNVGLAVGTSGRVYANLPPTAGTTFNILGPVPPPVVEMGTTAPTVLQPVENIGATTATFNGTVTIPAPGFPTKYRFEYSNDGVNWTGIPETPVEVGNATAGSYPVHQTVTGLDPNTLYSVRLTATTGPTAISSPVAFATEPSPPTVAQVVVAPEAERASFSALVNPRNQPTTYHFDWGTTTSYGGRTPGFERSVGSGGKFVAAQELLEGLQPDTTYHFRVVARNASGTQASEDHFFTTDRRAGQPGNRVPEMVSPPIKSAGGRVGHVLPVETDFRSRPDGNRVFYSIAYGLPDTTANGDVRYGAVRTPDGWTSTQLTPRQTVITQPDSGNESVGRHRFVSRDLSCGVISSGQPLTPDAPAALRDNNGTNLFVRNADGSYGLLTPTTPLNVSDPFVVGNIAQSGFNGYRVTGASPDCRRVVFDTLYSYPGLNAPPVQKPGLYVSHDGTLQDVGVMPDGSQAVNAEVGSGWNDDEGVRWRAVSADATRVYFTAISNGGNPPGTGDDTGRDALYLRDGNTTVKVSASQTSTANRGAFYQGAAVDGSRVAFLANYGLTTSSSSGLAASTCRDRPPHPCALYIYDVGTGELTDISADGNPADVNTGASVAGLVAASDDLSRVYFAAGGQLVENEGRTYSQNIAGQTSNLYLWDDGTVRFIATVRGDDLAQDSNLNQTAMLVRTQNRWKSQATPDGSSLLFSARANIVGYESGGVAEAYLYSAASGKTVCISCRPDGEPSVGTEQTTLLADGGTVVNFETSSPPRSLSADGKRAFFTSPDALAPGSVAGNRNVYEWNQGAIRLVATGSPAPSAGDSYVGPLLYEVSASGDDVFINTTGALDPRDQDEVNDLYDFRVDGGLPAPPVVEECDPLADDCSNGATGTPEPDDPASHAFDGPGNASQGSSRPKPCASEARHAKRAVSRAGRLRRALKQLRRAHRGSTVRAGVMKVRLRSAKRSARRARHRMAICQESSK